MPLFNTYLSLTRMRAGCKLSSNNTFTNKAIMPPSHIAFVN